MSAWLVSRGHEVRVVTAPPYYPEWKVSPGYSAWRYMREELDGARVYRVPLYVPATPSGLKRIIHLITFALTATPVILLQALFWRPHTIITTAPPLSVAPVVIAASWLCGAHSQLHVQDFEVEAAFQLGMLKRPMLYRMALKMERVLLRSFSKVSTISRRMRDRLVAKGVAKERTVLFPNWAGTEDFDPQHGPGQWRERLGIDSKTVIALYSGNVGRKQGLEAVVQAARVLQDTPHIRFVICGDGAARKELMESAEGLKNIQFLPVQPLDEFTHLMIAADIHLMPQRAEAADLVMPSKLGNILASARPVVAGATPGTQIYDAVQGCGIAVEPDNAMQFAQAVLKLANDITLRAGMGKAARRKALEEYSRDGILGRMAASL